MIWSRSGRWGHGQADARGSFGFEEVQGCDLSRVESECSGGQSKSESRAKWPRPLVGKRKKVCNSQCKPLIQQDFEAKFSVTVLFHVNPYEFLSLNEPEILTKSSTDALDINKVKNNVAGF